jgi:uncharacterized protein (DUF3084 family)
VAHKKSAEKFEVHLTYPFRNLKVDLQQRKEKVSFGNGQLEIEVPDGVRRANPNIDHKRSKYNGSLITPHEKTYEQEFHRICFEQGVKGKLKLTGEPKKQSKVGCAVLVPSPWKFGEVPLARQLEYFQKACDALCKKFGRQNVMSAQVHFDERTPHMHFTFVPIVKGMDKKSGQEINKVRMSDIWKGFNSYGKLQTWFHGEMVKDFDVRRGIPKSISGKDYIPDIGDFRKLKAEERSVAETPSRKNFLNSKEVIVDKEIFEERVEASVAYVRIFPEIQNLRRRRKEVGAKEEELAKREAQIREVEASAKQREQSTELMEKEAKEKLETLNAKTKELERAIIDAMPTAKLEVLRELADRESAVKGREDSVGVIEQDLNHREGSIAQREAEYAGKLDEIQSKENSVTLREDVVVAKEAELAGRDDALGSKEKSIKQREVALAPKESALAGREMGVEKQEKDLASMRDEFNAQVADHMAQVSGFNERMVELKAKEKTVATRERKLPSLEVMRNVAIEQGKLIEALACGLVMPGGETLALAENAINQIDQMSKGYQQKLNQANKECGGGDGFMPSFNRGRVIQVVRGREKTIER